MSGTTWSARVLFSLLLLGRRWRSHWRYSASLVGSTPLSAYETWQEPNLIPPDMVPGFVYPAGNCVLNGKGRGSRLELRTSTPEYIMHTSSP